MIATTRDGRHRSLRTIQETRKDIKHRWDLTTELEKIAIRCSMDEIGFISTESVDGFDSLQEVLSYSKIYHRIAQAHYIDRVAPIEEFILDDYYLGRVGKDVYPKWLEDLKELFSGRYTEGIFTGSIGSGKCLDGNTEFYNPKYGYRSKLVDVIGDDDLNVASHNAKSGEIESRSAVVTLSGEKFLGTLTLSSGKALRPSPDHPVLGPWGWVPVGDLERGDFVATALKLPSPEYCYDVTDEEVEFVAFMLTEGCCCSGNWAFTNANKKCLDRFSEVTDFLYKASVHWNKRGVHTKEEKGDMRTLYPRGTRWLQHKYSMYGTSHTKRVPAEFFGLSDRQLGLFLNRVWACDGNINSNTYEICLASEFFIRDIQHLLLRFGIHSRVKKRRVSWTYKGKKKWTWAWRLTVSSVDMLAKMSAAIGRVLGKEDAYIKLVISSVEKIGNSNVDITPVDNELSYRIRDELGVPTKEWKKYQIPSGQYMGRKKLLEIKEDFGLPEWCSNWTEFFWDKLDSYVVDEEMSPVYDIEVPGTKNFAPSGIIVHNTTACEIALCYMFYELCMLDNPQSTYGLMEGTEIVLVCFNRDKKLARDVTYGGVKTKIQMSPFFQDIGVTIGRSELIYERKNIRIIAVSVRSADALGRNVYGGIIDETDHLEGSTLRGGGLSAPGQKSFAELLHDSITRRMRSRYDRSGVLPGKLLLSSSARNKESFTNKRVGEASTDPTVFCRDYAIYDVKPAENFSRDKFWVLVGNARIRDKILSDGEYSQLTEDQRDDLKEQGCNFLHVPENFRGDFERNIEGAIREIGGLVTISISPYIQLRDKIYEAIDPTLRHPMMLDTWTTPTMPDINWDLLCRKVQRRIGPGVMEGSVEPRRHPQSPRHVHIDLSLGKTDCAGLCISHVAEYIDVERRSGEGHLAMDQAPIIEVDLLLQIKAPANGEIDIGSIRALIYMFIDHGFSFNYASLDSFQCLSENTPICTGRGIIPIMNVCVGDIVASRSGPRAVKNVFNFGRQKTIRITTQDGDILEGTLNHKIEVQSGWGPQGHFEHGHTKNPIWKWEEMGNLEIGDVVRMMDFDSGVDSEDEELFGDKRIFGWREGGLCSKIDNWEFPKRMNENFAEWLGLIWGDGDICLDSVRLTVCDEDYEDAANVFARLFGYKPSFQKWDDRGCGIARVSARWFTRWMKSNGIEKPLIPVCVMMSSKKVKSAFLRGLFATDGSVARDDGGISFSTKHRKLADQVRLILRCDFGIESCLTIVERGREGDYVKEGLQYYVSLRGARSKFFERIGFSYRSKMDKLEKHKDVKGRRIFSKIVCIEDSESDVIDLEVEDDPSYVANGFVSHNSAESIQKFRENGIQASVVSVDKNMEPYDYLKLALYEGRLVYYNYRVLIQELERLQRDDVARKVVHEQGGSKDVADALAGTVFTLSTKMHQRAPLMMGISEYEDKEAESSEWIRQTMTKAGDKAPELAGNATSPGPMIFTG